MSYSFPLVLAQEDAPATVQSATTVGPAPAVPATPSGTPQVATGTVASSQPGAAAPKASSDSPFNPMLLMLVVVGLFMFFSMRSNSKEKKKRAAMIANMKKGDKVLTIGGIYGSVVEVRDQDIILKTDENTNSRMRVTRAAVQAVVDDKEEPTAP
ncbi:MAG: preprotein translocase subunit YajC [Planctomycetes bacterium]|nr:preprotein translocase subunit YajC [Planctomycetota bacterium]